MIALVVAQALGGYSLGQLLIMVIVVAAAIAIVMVILRQMNASPPDFVIKIFWILLAAVIGIVALVFLFRVIGGSGL